MSKFLEVVYVAAIFTAMAALHLFFAFGLALILCAWARELYWLLFA